MGSSILTLALSTGVATPIWGFGGHHSPQSLLLRFPPFQRLLKPPAWLVFKFCQFPAYAEPFFWPHIPVSQCPHLYFFFFLINLFIFIYLFLAALGLRCCARAFSSCGSRASHCSGFSCGGAQALGARASVVVVHRLSCSLACGIFPDQGSNPCPLHWQADS